MKSQRRLYTLITFFLFVTLLLAACERPFAGNDTTTNDRFQPAETGDETANLPPAVDAGAPVGEPVGEPVTEPDVAEITATVAPDEAPPAYPAPEEEEAADTPRAEPEEEATPTPEPAPAPADEEAAAESAETASEPEQPAEPEAAETEEVSETAVTAAPSTNTHTVAAGENLYRIGLKYGISWVTLAEINNLANPNAIKVGQVLQLNGSAAPTPEPTPSPLTETIYTVKAGDNLYKIGLAYGIGWVQIAEANGIVNPNQILVGQELKIPVEAPGPTPQFTHTVQTGETLYLISLQYGVAWPTIAEANGLESPYVIYAGQTLVIPGGG